MRGLDGLVGRAEALIRDNTLPTVRRFKESTGGTVPVIIVTAVSRHLGISFRPRTAEDLSAMNADAYFEKPVNPQALLAKVEELLGSPKENPK